MRKIFFPSVAICLFGSCISTHIGTISSAPTGKNVTYEDIAYGVSQTNRYFGLGGQCQDALVLEARRKLILNRPLKVNEEYANFTVDFKNTYWPLYIQTKATISADVIRYTNDTILDRYSENYKNKLLGKGIANELFNIGDSVIDKRLKQLTIISFERFDKARVLYKTETDKIRTKKISLTDLFTKSKTFHGFKCGDVYAISKYDKKGNLLNTNTKIIGVGLNSFIIKGSGNDLEIIKYNNKK